MPNSQSENIQQTRCWARLLHIELTFIVKLIIVGIILMRKLTF